MNENITELHNKCEWGVKITIEIWSYKTEWGKAASYFDENQQKTFHERRNTSRSV